MTTLTLHKIFRYLTDDPNFLSTIIESNVTDKKNRKKKGFDLMANMVTDYVALAPYEIQTYQFFPSKVKEFLTPNYVRLGIKNVAEKDMTNVNISFLNSLNMLFRPEIRNLSLDEHLKNFFLLENFIIHKISRNYQIDKVKNTKKQQMKNKELISQLTTGKISHEIIQFIVNIFEINLLVFDFTKSEIFFYWAFGTKYPYLNLFRPVYSMCYAQGHYEPLFPVPSGKHHSGRDQSDSKLSKGNNMSETETIGKNFDLKKENQRLLLKILTHTDELKVLHPINLSVISLAKINDWKLNDQVYFRLINKFFNNSNRVEKSIDTYLDEMKDLEEVMNENKPSKKRQTILSKLISS